MIKILNYERVNRGKVIGEVDILLNVGVPFILRKIAHLQSGDKQWFNFPNFSRVAQGENKYLKYFEFETGAYNAQLLDSLGELVKVYCEEHNIPEIPPLDLMGFPEEPDAIF
jgi:hypothetical protein